MGCARVNGGLPPIAVSGVGASRAAASVLSADDLSPSGVAALGAPDRVELASLAGGLRMPGPAATAPSANTRDAHGRAWTQDVAGLADAAAAGGALAQAAQSHAGALLHGAAEAGGEPGAIARRIGASAATASAFGAGVGEGVAAGVRGFVASTLTLAGGAARLAGDASPLGDLGDFAREHGPAALRDFAHAHDEWIPSSRRGGETVAAGMRTLHGVGAYAARAGSDPAGFGHDVSGTIGRVWDGVRADHAQATAQGPGAEARWFGRLAGRAGFEAAATAVPGVGLAERAGAAARVAGGLEESAAVASRVARGADAGTLLTDAARADAAEPGRFAIDARHAAEAYRTRGDIGALVDGARRTGRLPQLLDANVLTDGETATLLRAGKIAPTELPEVRIASPRDPNLGDPAAIYHGYGRLSPRQEKLFRQLEATPKWIGRKGDVSVRDIAALTAHSGDEFALFTRGPQRFVLRGNATNVDVTPTRAKILAAEGWKWTAHSHPGTSSVGLTASTGDQQVLRAFGQRYGLIVNGRGEVNVFTPDDALWIQPKTSKR